MKNTKAYAFCKVQMLDKNLFIYLLFIYLFIYSIRRIPLHTQGKFHPKKRLLYNRDMKYICTKSKLINKILIREIKIKIQIRIQM